MISLNGSNGFTLNGAAASDLFGYSVSSAGDVNADGIDDLIIGAYAADPDGIDSAGSSYVVFGKRDVTFKEVLNYSIKIDICRLKDFFAQKSQMMRIIWLIIEVFTSKYVQLWL